MLGEKAKFLLIIKQIDNWLKKIQRENEISTENIKQFVETKIEELNFLEDDIKNLTDLKTSNKVDNMTIKENLTKLINQLESKSESNTDISNEIKQLKEQVNKLDETLDFSEVKDKLDNVVSQLPKGLSGCAITTSAFLTPLILISKIVYDFYWDKYKTPHNIDTMLELVKNNLESDKAKENKETKTKK